MCVVALFRGSCPFIFAPFKDFCSCVTRFRVSSPFPCPSLWLAVPVSMTHFTLPFSQFGLFLPWKWMEAACPSTTFLIACHTTQCCSPEGHGLNLNCVQYSFMNQEPEHHVVQCFVGIICIGHSLKSVVNIAIFLSIAPCCLVDHYQYLRHHNPHWSSAVLSSLCPFDLCLLESCSCEVNKEATSGRSSLNGEPSCSCQSRSGIYLSSPWRKYHRVANYSFSYDEGELHLYNRQLQHRGHEVRRWMGQQGYLLHVHVYPRCCPFHFKCVQFPSLDGWAL